MHRLFLGLLFLLAVQGCTKAPKSEVAATAPAIKTELVDYEVDGAKLQALIAYDDAIKGKRPGVVIFHDWLGRGPYAEKRAKQLAELGYVAFAADLYGIGVYAKDHDEAAKLTGVYGDRSMMRKRSLAALELIKKNPMVDDSRVAVMGYCFGGTASLELARSGAEFGGAVVFHGSLDAKSTEGTKPIKAKVLVLIGADDKFVTPAIPDFEDEMRKANADWQLTLYSNTVHGYTVPTAGNDPSTGAAYSAQSDARSWQAMRDFFAEIFNSH
jgi:dienelactone hydrolase